MTQRGSDRSIITPRIWCFNRFIDEAELGDVPTGDLDSFVVIGWVLSLVSWIGFWLRRVCMVSSPYFGNGVGEETP